MNKATEVGILITEYEKSVWAAFESVRKLKALNIGHPWIEIEFKSSESSDWSFGSNGMVDILKRYEGQEPLFYNVRCKIRLEVR